MRYILNPTGRYILACLDDANLYRLIFKSYFSRYITQRHIGKRELSGVPGVWQVYGGAQPVYQRHRGMQLRRTMPGDQAFASKKPVFEKQYH